MTRTGSRISLRVYPGQRFGSAAAPTAIVIDPEVRIYQTEAKPAGYRGARMKCRCGTVYVAQIAHLYAGRAASCADCSRRQQYRKARNPAGRAYRAARGWCVVVYVGHYKSRAEAEDVASRSRAVVLPPVRERPAAL